jgi:hypothetical protein
MALLINEVALGLPFIYTKFRLLSSPWVGIIEPFSKRKNYE